MNPVTLPAQPNTRNYWGRLLTMSELPSDLLAGQVLRVAAGTVVTPEVRDALRQRQVRLQLGGDLTVTGGTTPSDAVGMNAAEGQRAVGVSAALTSANGRPLQVWWHGTEGMALTVGPETARLSGSSMAWLGRLDARLNGALRAVAESRSLADQVAEQIAVAGEQWSGPTQLVFSQRPWEIQRELAQRHGVFAWCVASAGPVGWEQARTADASLLLCSPPLTSWIVRRWLALVNPRGNVGAQGHDTGVSSALRKS